jgi:uncharacterized protein YndB with AHSA1/START domain
MRSLVIALALVGVAVALLGLAGALLPRNHRATSLIRLAHSPAMVFAVVRNQAGVPSWWPEVKKVERQPDQVGQERWRQTLGNGYAMTIIVAESEPPTRMRTVIDAEPGAAFGGAWIFELTPVGNGTEVRITEEGWVANPFFRVFARLMGHHQTIDSYLTALAQRFGETGTPTHRP